MPLVHLGGNVLRRQRDARRSNTISHCVALPPYMEVQLMEVQRCTCRADTSACFKPSTVHCLIAGEYGKGIQMGLGRVELAVVQYVGH